MNNISIKTIIQNQQTYQFSAIKKTGVFPDNSCKNNLVFTSSLAQDINGISDLNNEPVEEINIAEVTIFKKSLFKSKNLQPVKALIKKEINKKAYETYNIYVAKDKVGYIDFDNPGKEDKPLYIRTLKSLKKKKYKGTGTRLIQLAIEKSLKSEGHGRVELYAKKLEGNFRSPVGFYLKCGFTKGNKGNKGVRMYLSDEAIEKWKQKINASPILPETK